MENGVYIGNITIPAITGKDGKPGNAGKIVELRIKMLETTEKPSIENKGTESEAIIEIGIPKCDCVQDANVNEEGYLILSFESKQDINAGYVKGLGIEKARIEDGQLIITRSDNSTIIAGNVVGPKGDPFKYEDFTEEQLKELIGPEGPAGQNGKDGERGPEGPPGPKGDSFKFEDITEEDFKKIKQKVDPVPIGTGFDYFGTDEPEGYMFADGRDISRTDYAELFKILGTTYGEGDGETTFNLPDKRERVSVMCSEESDTFNKLGLTTGEKKHTMTKEELVEHSHYVRDGDNNKVLGSQGVVQPDRSWGINIDSRQGRNSTWMTDNVGSSQPFNIIQPSLVCNYIIKVK